jgi:hypothetical protein
MPKFCHPGFFICIKIVRANRNTFGPSLINTLYFTLWTNIHYTATPPLSSRLAMPTWRMLTKTFQTARWKPAVYTAIESSLSVHRSEATMTATVMHNAIVIVLMMHDAAKTVLVMHNVAKCLRMLMSAVLVLEQMPVIEDQDTSADPYREQLFSYGQDDVPPQVKKEGDVHRLHSPVS